MTEPHETPNNNNNTPPAQPSWRVWLKRVGVAGFLFFLAKGLLWIAVFMGLGKLIGC